MRGQLSDRERLYYSRQMIMPSWNEDTQIQLKNTRVLVIGAGGLSCPMLQSLARAGIGRLGIVDGDFIQYSNLHRQSLFEPADVGLSKAEVAGEKLNRINPHIEIDVYKNFLTQENASRLFSKYDLVADGTDNFPTRYLVNDYAVKMDLVNVFAAVNGFEGQLAVFNYPLEDGNRSGHYRNIFPHPPTSKQIPNCAEQGVLGATTAILGSLQAAEVIKVILRSTSVFYNQLIHIDLQSMEQRRIRYSSCETDWSKISNKDYDHSLCAPNEKKGHELEKSYLELLKNNRKGTYLNWIDVRSEREHRMDPLAGHNIPWSSDLDLSQYRNFSPLVFYCQTGDRSLDVLKAFKRQYPEAEAYSLKGGIDSWLYDYENTSE